MVSMTVAQWVLALAVGVLGTARLTRILVHDGYPPAEWVRGRWTKLVGDDWGVLMTCFWCAQPYIAAICMAWAYFTEFHWTWWAFWGWMALSQAGSMVLAYDEPAE